MNDKDRINANEYHFCNYRNILSAINDRAYEEAKAICIREMNIISIDDDIEYSEGKIIELADLRNLPSSKEYK